MSDAGELPISAGAPVPVFNCVVYVSTGSDGQVTARVANLLDLSCVADSERAALTRLVAEFKQRVSNWTQAGEPIPWIDPPEPAAEGEQKRFVPVHL